MLNLLNQSILHLFIITTISQPSHQYSVRIPYNEESESTNTRIKSKVMCMTAESERISYPGSVEQAVERSAVSPNSPTPCPDDKPYCTSTDDYPKDKIKEILQQQPKALLNHFYVDTKEDNYPVDKFGPIDSERETSLCVTQTEVVYPTKAKSKNGFYEFVVNDEKNRQGIKVETCLNKEMSCSSIVSFPLGYQAHCVQKYVTRILVVAEANQSDVHGIVTKPFDFPSCCSCVLKLEDPSRFGQSLATPAHKPTKIRV